MKIAPGDVALVLVEKQILMTTVKSYGLLIADSCMVGRCWLIIGCWLFVMILVVVIAAADLPFMIVGADW